jgi:hypothetical protein
MFPSTVNGFYRAQCHSNLVISLWVPGTKELPLKQLELVSSTPTTKFMRYQLRVALLFWVNRWAKASKTKVQEALLSDRNQKNLKVFVVNVNIQATSIRARPTIYQDKFFINFNPTQHILDL